MVGPGSSGLPDPKAKYLDFNALFRHYRKSRAIAVTPHNATISRLSPPTMPEPRSRFRELARELRPHIVWDAIKLLFALGLAGMITVGVGIFQWSRHHFDLLFLFSVFICSAAMLTSAAVLKTRKGGNGDLKKRTRRIANERLLLVSEETILRPELRPYVVPVKYTRLPNLPVLGLETANDGESTAYQVTIPDVKMGTSTINFQADCPRLTKDDEHVYWRVLIQVDTGSVTTGNDLAREMTRQGVGQVEVAINYDDRDHRYATIFELQRNVLASDTGGISIGPMRQVLIEDRPENKTPPVPADAPELVLDYNYSDQVPWSHEVPSPDKPIIVKNVTPGRNAFNVTIRPLVTADGTAEFTPSLVSCIEGGNQAEFNARVEGITLPIRNQLVDLLIKSYKEDNPDYDMTRDLFGPKSFTVTIEYEDSSGHNRYAADCEITYTKWHNKTHPGKHRIRKIT